MSDKAPPDRQLDPGLLAWAAKNAGDSTAGSPPSTPPAMGGAPPGKSVVFGGGGLLSEERRWSPKEIVGPVWKVDPKAGLRCCARIGTGSRVCMVQGKCSIASHAKAGPPEEWLRWSSPPFCGEIYVVPDWDPSKLQVMKAYASPAIPVDWVDAIHQEAFESDQKAYEGWMTEFTRRAAVSGAKDASVLLAEFGVLDRLPAGSKEAYLASAALLQTPMKGSLKVPDSPIEEVLRVQGLKPGTLPTELVEDLEQLKEGLGGRKETDEAMKVLDRKVNLIIGSLGVRLPSQPPNVWEGLEELDSAVQAMSAIGSQAIDAIKATKLLSTEVVEKLNAFTESVATMESSLLYKASEAAEELIDQAFPPFLTQGFARLVLGEAGGAGDRAGGGGDAARMEALELKVEQLMAAREDDKMPALLDRVTGLEARALDLETLLGNVSVKVGNQTRQVKTLNL